MSERLSVLYVCQAPPSPPRYGAQVRMHGLITAVAERHDVSVACCAEPDLAAPARRAMRAYSREVEIVVERASTSPVRKRLLQLRSLASARTFERHLFTVPELQRRIDALLSRRRFDVVNVEGPFVAHHRFRAAPRGAPPPRLVLDEHNVEFDLHRQIARGNGGLVRRFYSAVNWRKLQREEYGLWERFDAITVTSRHDEARVRAARPAARVAVVPNGVDVEHYRPRPGDPPPDRSTILFFGALDYHPNQDGILHFLDEVWPRLLRTHPSARLRILGRRPPPALLARRGPAVEVGGFVEDLRPSIASAAAIVVPLRLGGGTRLKILEAMAMARPVVSTALGAEGIEAAHGKELLVADGPDRFAGEVARLLDDPALGARLGHAARALVETRYSWRASAMAVERCFREVCAVADARDRARVRAGYGAPAIVTSSTVTE
ncbi:MAG TPA: glycosyltransferase family 4 protein [Anaeromyxobacter sp.]|nr:glycosyltransferase family 4 protein [Anaeromyxobacter sp.]